MLSLRGPEFDEKPQFDDRLPPIHQEPEPEMLFQSRTDLKQAQSEHDYMRAESRLSLTSPERFDILILTHSYSYPIIICFLFIVYSIFDIQMSEMITLLFVFQF